MSNQSGVIKIGPKGRHLEVPDGWQIVKSGHVIHGDKFANLMTAKWETVWRDDVGMEVAEFNYIIRKRLY